MCHVRLVVVGRGASWRRLQARRRLATLGAPATVGPVTTLVERLGYGTDDRVLVVSCAELGVFHAGNVAIYEALRNGTATTATLMVPAPWARGAAAQYRGEDVGVGLTLNAEHDLYRWGPITQAPSLLDGDGGFPRTAADLWDHADLDEVRRECRAQLERAIYWGFDVSHLDAHLDAVQLKPEFFDVFLDLAEEFRLPLRLPDAGAQRLAGFPFRELAAERGVVSPDRVILTGGPAGRGDPATAWRRARRWRPACTRRPRPTRDATPGAAPELLAEPRARRHRDLPSAGARHNRAAGGGARLAGAHRRPPAARGRGGRGTQRSRQREVELVGYRALRELMREPADRRRPASDSPREPGV